MFLVKKQAEGFSDLKGLSLKMNEEHEFPEWWLVGHYEASVRGMYESYEETRKSGVRVGLNSNNRSSFRTVPKENGHLRFCSSLHNGAQDLFKIKSE